ncbi:hypothetical protein L596_015253 [Steinernema carpocapsae]|uniref:Uncharacterized protein n=1 Tax=Steinernema carpocapsae TaxID=34508 RepID=A0A4U5NFB9_STECR|nr:hypothetical protein L596_015253 [Steinernema carpocapsae]
MSSSLCAYRRTLFLPVTTSTDVPRFSWSSSALKSIYGEEEPALTSAIKRPVPLSLQHSVDSASPPRKSLSTRFLETKEQKQPIDSSLTSLRKPYGDDAVEISTDEEEHHNWNHADTESEEDVEKAGEVKLLSNRPLGAEEHEHQADDMRALREGFLKTHYPSGEAMTDSSEDEDDEEVERRNIANLIRPASLSVSMLAGDGNPVRHSLVNLVLQEDLPMLMEAMTEECNVSFEDFSDETTASTSSIIHPHNERKERRQRRNVDRICFVEEPPQVFAYLDEKSCEVDEDDLWQQGEHITYDRYQKLVEATTEEQLQAQLELSRWHQSIQKQAPVESQSPNSNEFALGVTSKLSYGGLQSFNQPIAIASNDINTSSI